MSSFLYFFFMVVVTNQLTATVRTPMVRGAKAAVLRRNSMVVLMSLSMQVEQPRNQIQPDVPNRTQDRSQLCQHKLLGLQSIPHFNPSLSLPTPLPHPKQPDHPYIPHSNPSPSHPKQHLILIRAIVLQASNQYHHKHRHHPQSHIHLSLTHRSHIDLQLLIPR